MMPEDQLLRRTWPQRFVLIGSLVVIVAALGASWLVRATYQSVAGLGRIEISGDVLVGVGDSAQPMNFLLVGTDSGKGLGADDTINNGRKEDSRGYGFADTIAILRLDPVSQQAWVLPIPRDLFVPIPGSPSNRINAAHLVGGPQKLIETINGVFDIEINHYVEVDFKGFQEVVDQIGGVPVWFPNPTRSVATGLNVLDEGGVCRVLDGVEALAYVRPRKDYEEFIDGRWVITGGRDFERIQRQQDFLVLALDRAIKRGARNPQTMLQLIKAGAKSVILDSQLTPAELRKLAQSFSSFSSDNITRYSLTVTTSYAEDGTYIGELWVEGADSDALAVFRGGSDSVRPSGISVDVFGADSGVLSGDSKLLADIGFDVASQQQIDTAVAQSVVIYPPGQLASAETIARYLLPVPALIEDVSATRITLVFGANHQQVLFLFPQDTIETRRQIALLGPVEQPDLGDAVATVSTTTSVDTSTTVTDSTTTTQPAVASIMGRPPEGQTCG